MSLRSRHVALDAQAIAVLGAKVARRFANSGSDGLVGLCS